MGGVLKWTLELLQQEALKYKTRGEFRKDSPNAYKSAQTQKILDKVCQHMEMVRLKWNEESIHQEALKYNMREDFKRGNSKAYRAARSQEIMDKVCSHMVCNLVFRTKEEVLAEALTFKTRKEYEATSPNGYATARRMGILKQATEHMAICKPGNKYSVEDILLAASKYKTRNEFAKKSPNFYARARKRGVLELACANMPVISRDSLVEVDLLSIIKEKFPKAQKYIDRKVKIEGRPLIQGFEIDIYIPELRKGIEFDGTYYHSPNGLKRGRPKWDYQDLVNYHQIKDEYFKSKNIELFHIKEKDWTEDREGCIKKCLEFLKND